MAGHQKFIDIILISSFQPGTSFFTTWPTCIAVIYSINDVGSFTTASKLLQEIDTSVRLESGDAQLPAIALIGNKSDLSHLRNVREVCFHKTINLNQI